MACARVRAPRIGSRATAAQRPAGLDRPRHERQGAHAPEPAAAAAAQFRQGPDGTARVRAEHARQDLPDEC